MQSEALYKYKFKVFVFIYYLPTEKSHVMCKEKKNVKQND